MSNEIQASVPHSGFLLWRATNAWQRAQRAALEPFELTHVQYVLLATLAGEDARKGLSQAEVSQRSGVDPMTTSQVLRNLEGRDLLARTAHPEDKRARRVAVTSAGRALVRKAAARAEKADNDFFATAGKSKAALVAGLEALCQLDS